MSALAMAVEADGKILVGGSFFRLGGQSRRSIGQLHNIETATESLTIDGSAITWLRGGTSPGVWRTTFEASTDGTDWVALGAGSRILGGWRLANVPLPPGGTLRARGYVTGGQYNGSAWFVESGWPTTAPILLADDGNLGFRSNRFGFNFTGTVGSTVAVDGTTNFADWVSLATNLMPGGPLYFTDSAGTNFQGRFYRARLLP